MFTMVLGILLLGEQEVLILKELIFKVKIEVLEYSIMGKCPFNIQVQEHLHYKTHLITFLG